MPMQCRYYLPKKVRFFQRFSPLFTSISTRINDFHGDGQMAGLTGGLWLADDCLSATSTFRLVRPCGHNRNYKHFHKKCLSKSWKSILFIMKIFYSFWIFWIDSNMPKLKCCQPKIIISSINYPNKNKKQIFISWSAPLPFEFNI